MRETNVKGGGELLNAAQNPALPSSSSTPPTLSHFPSFSLSPRAAAAAAAGEARCAARGMDGLDDEWDDDKFLAELFRAQDEAVASRNPNPTPPPPPPPPDPISYLPPPSTSSYLSSSAAAAALPLSYITPGPHVFSAAPVHFLPPRELSQHPQGFDVGLRDFSPPRELSQRPAAEVSSREIVAVSSGIAGADRFRGGGGGGARRERDAREAADRREVERLKVRFAMAHWRVRCKHMLVWMLRLPVLLLMLVI